MYFFCVVLYPFLFMVFCVLMYSIIITLLESNKLKLSKQVDLKNKSHNQPVYRRGSIIVPLIYFLRKIDMYFIFTLLLFFSLLCRKKYVQENILCLCGMSQGLCHILTIMLLILCDILILII